MLTIYNIRILYIKGIENKRVDTLSKKLEYLSNKINESRTILRNNRDILIFNI
jgi:hypothetical protein